MNKNFWYGTMVAVLLGTTACGSEETSNVKLPADPHANEAPAKLEKPSEGIRFDKKLNAQANPLAKEVTDQNPSGPITTLAFAEKIHDFGRIKQDTKNEHIFNFTNTGEHPLMISSARGSCGCTVPQYPKEPIAPGEKGEIKVVFSSGKKKGKQHKTVTLNCNVEGGTEKLVITADIELPEGEQAKPVAH